MAFNTPSAVHHSTAYEHSSVAVLSFSRLCSTEDFGRLLGVSLSLSESDLRSLEDIGAAVELRNRSCILRK